MSTTPNLLLPLMEANQDQPEVVYNEAMQILDDLDTSSSASLTLIGADGSPTTEVVNVTQIQFTGATVTDAGGGIAQVAVSSSGGGGSANPSHGAFSALTISSNTITLDLSTAGIFDLTLTANVTTVNITNLTSGDANFFTLRIKQDAIGSRSFTVPASWKFPTAAGAYSVTTDPNAVDLLQGVSFDNGTTWQVSYQKKYA